MPSEQMTCPERCLWYTLRDVYRRFRSGDITKAQGEKEKHQATRQYELDVNALASAEQIIRHNADMWMEIELAASAYILDRTIEHADQLLDAIYGVKHKRGRAEQKEHTEQVEQAEHTEQAGGDNGA